MTNVEPPHGGPDLAGQVDSIEAERAQIAAERAKMAAERAELEQETALVRQRRTREDEQRPRIVDGYNDDVMSPRVDAPRSPAVVDSDGEEYETDIETGELIRDGFGQPIPKWKHQTIELDGEVIQVRKPQAMALQAFSMASSEYTPKATQAKMMTLFVINHISPLSYERLLTRMMSGDDEFTVTDFGRVFEAIMTLDTGRPSGPSQP